MHRCSKVSTSELNGTADLVWASFPCQDLSLAGAGAGIRGARTGAFWPFWHLVENLRAEQRAPKVVVLENVVGTLTSRAGEDFRSLVSTVSNADYRVGALIVDAVHFLPQSRPRMFLIAVRNDLTISGDLDAGTPTNIWHTKRLASAYESLPDKAKDAWVWWHLPQPPKRRLNLVDILDPEDDVRWDEPETTKGLLDLMSDVNRRKVMAVKKMRTRVVGTVYKRTRIEGGKRKQRAEVRFDGVSGCLRTPGGGSSRQTILQVNGGIIRSRSLSVREAARLMGLKNSYILPENYNDAYHLLGDGLAVPVVSWIERHLLRKLVSEVGSTVEPYSDLQLT